MSKDLFEIQIYRRASVSLIMKDYITIASDLSDKCAANFFSLAEAEEFTGAFRPDKERVLLLVFSAPYLQYRQSIVAQNDLSDFNPGACRIYYLFDNIAHAACSLVMDADSASLEAQLANFADEIAYNNHDVDDGLRSGLMTLNQLEEVSIFSRHLTQVKDNYPLLAERRMVYETVRRMINTLVIDLIQQSTRNIKDAGVDTLVAVHTAPPLIGFSQQTKKEQQELKKFLFDNLYRHFRVVRMNNRALHTIEVIYSFQLGDTTVAYQISEKV